MYIESTIHPYHSIVKSKVHQNQPFQKPICYYIRIEERERERKGRKEGKMDTILYFTFQEPTQKSRLFQFVKDISTNGIPEFVGVLCAIFGIPIIRTIWSVSRFLEFLDYETICSSDSLQIG